MSEFNDFDMGMEIRSRASDDAFGVMYGVFSRTEQDLLPHTILGDELPQCVVDADDSELSLSQERPNAITALRQQLKSQSALLGSICDFISDEDDVESWVMYRLWLLDILKNAADAVALGLCGIGPVLESAGDTLRLNGIKAMSPYEERFGVLVEKTDEATCTRFIGCAPLNGRVASCQTAVVLHDRVDKALASLKEVPDYGKLPRIVYEAWHVIWYYVGVESQLMLMSTEELADECMRMAALMRHASVIDEHRFGDESLSVRLVSDGQTMLATFDINGVDVAHHHPVCLRLTSRYDDDETFGQIVMALDEDEPLHFELDCHDGMHVSGPFVRKSDDAYFVEYKADDEVSVIYDDGNIHIENVPDYDVEYHQMEGIMDITTRDGNGFNETVADIIRDLMEADTDE